MKFNAVPPGSEIRIYTVTGRHVMTLVSTAWDPSWDLKNSQGEPVASGTYLWALVEGNEVKKLEYLAVIR